MPTLIEIARAYILRGEAYSALQEHFTEGGFKDYTDGQKCFDRIKAIPAADVVKRPRWIPVTERLPEKDKWVLRYSAITGATWLAYRNSIGVWMDEQGKAPYITHWMPLPEPPEDAP